MSEFIFGETNNEALVRVPQGSKITIALEENPTTAYRWATREVNELFLTPEGDVFLTGAQAGNGYAGVRQFFFRAKAAGQIDVRFVQKRQWETDEEGASYFALRIEIHEN
jgi:predicted secreted protein